MCSAPSAQPSASSFPLSLLTLHHSAWGTVSGGKLSADVRGQAAPMADAARVHGRCRAVGGGGCPVSAGRGARRGRGGCQVCPQRTKRSGAGRRRQFDQHPGTTATSASRRTGWSGSRNSGAASSQVRLSRLKATALMRHPLRSARFCLPRRQTRAADRAGLANQALGLAHPLGCPSTARHRRGHAHTAHVT